MNRPDIVVWERSQIERVEARTRRAYEAYREPGARYWRELTGDERAGWQRAATAMYSEGYAEGFDHS